jgi:hypothetical protein
MKYICNCSCEICVKDIKCDHAIPHKKTKDCLINAIQHDVKCILVKEKKKK